MFSKFWRHGSKGNGHWSNLSLSPELLYCWAGLDNFNSKIVFQTALPTVTTTLTKDDLCRAVPCFHTLSSLSWAAVSSDCSRDHSLICTSHNSTSHLHILTAKCFSLLYIYNHSLPKTPGHKGSGMIKAFKAHLCLPMHVPTLYSTVNFSVRTQVRYIMIVLSKSFIKNSGETVMINLSQQQHQVARIKYGNNWVRYGLLSSWCSFVEGTNIIYPDHLQVSLTVHLKYLYQGIIIV